MGLKSMVTKMDKPNMPVRAEILFSHHFSDACVLHKCKHYDQYNTRVV